LFSLHNAEKYGYLGVVWESPCTTDKLDAVCYITESLTFFDCLFIYVPEKMSSNTLHFLSLKGNTFWTGVVWPVMSLSLSKKYT